MCFLYVMEKPLRKQPLEDLAEMLKTLQGKEKIQDHMEGKFQKLIRNKGVSFSVIEGFPYPNFKPRYRCKPSNP